MGSSGTGNFTDYTKTSIKASINEKSGEGKDEDTETRCLEVITINLEDVERCDYYNNRKELPEKGALVSLSLQQRLVVTTTSGEVIGLVPTSYNYLAGCLKQGLSYKGTVVSTTAQPLQRVQVSLSL